MANPSAFRIDPEVGVFARNLPGGSLEAVLDTAVSIGLPVLQFNLSCAGLEALPATLEPSRCRQIRRDFEVRGLSMWGVSATFNAIHPDREARLRDTAAAIGVIERAGELGTGVVTLCTGTRDANDKWRHHPDNEREDAWDDLLATMRALLAAAEPHQVSLAIEPEAGNVVSTPDRARRLIEQLESDRVGVIVDPGNLVAADDVAHQGEVLEEAVAMLAPWILASHIKEIPGSEPEAIPGEGPLDYEAYLALLNAHAVSAPLIIQDAPLEALPQIRERLVRLGGALRPSSPTAAVSETGTTEASGGIKLAWERRGEGAPVVALHGLGGDRAQALALVPEELPALALDFRAHGDTRPVGDPAALDFESFAGDLLTVLERLDLRQPVVLVGVSMGAGVALRFAAEHPRRTAGLLLVRPAWGTQPLPSNLASFPEIASLLQTVGPEAGLRDFSASPRYAEAHRVAPAVAESLAAQFEREDAVARAAVLDRMPRSVPVADLEAIGAPARVLGCHDDPLHPFEIAAALAAEIPRARLTEIPAKAAGEERYHRAVHYALSGLLLEVAAAK